MEEKKITISGELFSVKYTTEIGCEGTLDTAPSSEEITIHEVWAKLYDKNENQVWVDLTDIYDEHFNGVLSETILQEHIENQ